MNPSTKQMVMSSNKPGKILRIISRESIGLPAFKNDNKRPPTPINPPPTPTREKNAPVMPCIASQIGSKKMVIPATPWTRARTMIDILFDIRFPRVRITASNPMKTKIR